MQEGQVIPVLESEENANQRMPTDPFAFQPEDIMKLVMCDAHVGRTQVDFQFEQYVWKRRDIDGVAIINLNKLWAKLQLAARAIAAVEDPSDVFAITNDPLAHRAVLKYAAHTGATPLVGRFMPGSLTNQSQKRSFKEPRLLIVSDTRVDKQALLESSYVNAPVIGFCNTHSKMQFIDIAIPCNNSNAYSIGLLWWMLAREVLLLRGKIASKSIFILAGQEIMPDLYFHRETIMEPIVKEQPAEQMYQPMMGDHDYQPIMGMHDYQQIEQVPVPVADETEESGKLDLDVEPIEDWSAIPAWDTTANTDGKANDQGGSTW